MCVWVSVCVHVKLGEGGNDDEPMVELSGREAGQGGMRVAVI